MSNSHPPLLRTKLHAPQTQPGLVVRERILARLDEIPLRRLTLISAPAGFGKTTAIISWILRSGWRPAWLSLDPDDNNPSRFLAYVIGALQSVQPEAGVATSRALESSEHPPLQTLVTSLLNELSRLDEQILLVLDDYHLIQEPEIHDAMLFLIEHAPEQLRVLMTTRADPSFPIARLRVCGQLLELRAADLRFSADEASLLFSQQTIALSNTQVNALLKKTEGWIAGLQMAALSLRGRSDPDAFIRDFTGADRYVLDYLLEEVLRQLPSGMQRVMLALSVLERFSGELCDAVTGFSDGAVLLEQLEESNLFLVPLDDRREWYRYHKLFGDLLLHRLTQLTPEEIPVLHKRASRWFAEQGHVLDAVEHARRSGDAEFLCATIETHWRVVLRDAGTINLRAMRGALSRNRVLASPRLSLVVAWLQLLVSEHETIDETLCAAERLASSEPNAPDLADVLSQATMLRAVLARDEGDNERTIALTRRVLELLPRRPPGSADYLWYMSEGMILAVLGGAYDQTRRFDDARAIYEESIRFGRAADDQMCVVAALSNTGRMMSVRGDLDTALRTADEMLEHADKPEFGQVGIPAVPHQIRARVFYERGEVEKALEEIGIAMTLMEPITQKLEFHRILLCIQELAGDRAGMQATIQSASRLNIPLKSRRMNVVLPILRAVVAFRLGQADVAIEEIDGIRDWIEEMDALTPEAIDQRDVLLLNLVRLTNVRVLLAAGDAAAALALLEREGRWFEHCEMLPNVVQMLVLQAITFERLGRNDEALASIARALARAAGERIMRPFMLDAPALEHLLQALTASRREIRREIPPKFLKQVIEACSASWEDAAAHPIVLPDDLQLSDREREILALLEKGYSNQKIADRLYLSVNTIKTHISNLYDKLGVANRAEAVARAAELVRE